MTVEAALIRGRRTVTDLVTRAVSGDKQAWDALVERYAPLVWSICRRYRLTGTDAAGVCQLVWLQLLDQLGNLRDPATLAGWLALTTQRECWRVLCAPRPATATSLTGTGDTADQHTAITQPELLRAERYAALREAFTHLPPRCQQLLALLIHDPPLPYAQISATLGIPAGDIGPLRKRCLHMLRSDPAITTLVHSEAAPGRDGPGAGGQGASSRAAMTISRRSGLAGPA
jgi:RNA polymerase sigma factor (sigma-70 family)